MSWTNTTRIRRCSPIPETPVCFPVNEHSITIACPENSERKVHITGKAGSFISLLAASMDKKVLVLYENEDEADLVREEISYYGGRDVALFPPFEDRFFEEEDNIRRSGFLYRLVNEERFTGLFPVASISHPLPGRDSVLAGVMTIRVGDTVFQENVRDYLEKKGYEMAPLVRETGQYAKRGSIIDMFPPASEKPVRCEFIGDSILSVRHFDPVSQRSERELSGCEIAAILKDSGDSSSTIIDYLEGSGILLVHPGTSSLLNGLESDGPSQIKARWVQFLETARQIDHSGIEGPNEGTSFRAVSNDDLRQLFIRNRNQVFQAITEKIQKEWLDHPFVYLFANTPHQAKRLQDIFESYGLTLPVLPGISYPEAAKERGIIHGPIRRGFRTDSIIVLTEDDIAGPKKRVVKKKWDRHDEFLSSFKDLATGEWVVHVDHGIGIYRGITPLTVNGFTKDFLLIEYQDGDKLYVPVNDLHLVQKFIGSEKFKPRIDRLGSTIWRNTKRKVRRQIEDMAEELLTMYAERKMAGGYGFPPEDELFREMESRFEFEETPGQVQAINDVLGDLMEAKPMDRLVCGDVGFGKTEVAMRATFKVVLDGKQTALLVPTTVLAQQHYKTFGERFADYPIVIGMLSRFRTPQEQKDTAESLRKGQIDIIIGTHRLLQKDVSFRDLGLIIIDEEQRFGVKHKEKLKLFKKNVDVLTLSATPIPRTLYMATSGIKDLSVIDTPPLDRLAVKTSVIKFNDTVVSRGIRKELDRSGQIFFVHNYIHNIGVIYDHLSRIVPDARIAVAHGQMSGKKLEKIMTDFIEKRYDILLSTNIIESGLDISNVNTIFINNAHKMGLADIYQLRGRVGRSTQQAYAYLLVPENEQLTRDATTRLKIIEELTDLGSGFHIANYDLEIRGAGNLVGKEQSGNVNLIGFELYCDMLEKTMNRLKDSEAPQREEIVTEINIPVNAFIPDTYIEDPTQKLLMYKRLSRICREDEVNDIGEEIKDRYGALPDPLVNLLGVISLKSFLTALKVRKIEKSGKQTVLHITEETPLDMKKLLGLVTDGHRRIKLLPDGRIVIQTDLNEWELMNFIRNILMDIVAL